MDTFLFVVFLVKVVEREKWPLTLMVAVATTAGLFITFQISVEDYIALEHVRVLV